MSPIVSALNGSSASLVISAVLVRKLRTKPTAQLAKLGKLSDSLILKEIQPSGLFGGKKTGESVPYRSTLRSTLRAIAG